MALKNKEVRRVAREIAKRLGLKPRAKRLLDVVLEIVVNEAPGGEFLTEHDLLSLGLSEEAHYILETIELREGGNIEFRQQGSGLALLHALGSKAARSRLRDILYRTPTAAVSPLAFLIDYD